MLAKILRDICDLSLLHPMEGRTEDKSKFICGIVILPQSGGSLWLDLHRFLS